VKRAEASSRNGDTAPAWRWRTRCGARCRDGSHCRRPKLAGRTRCRAHGGASSGPRTAAGRTRSARNSTTHGAYESPARLLELAAAAGVDLGNAPGGTDLTFEIRFARAKLARLAARDPELRHLAATMDLLKQIRQLVAEQHGANAGAALDGKDFHLVVSVVHEVPAPATGCQRDGVRSPSREGCSQAGGPDDGGGTCT
jgi:hypothetical protein